LSKKNILKKFIAEKILPKAIGTYLNSLALVAPNKSGQKALQIFSTPRKGKLRPKDIQYLSKFEKIQLQYKEFTIQAYKKGCGQLKVLFLHGWESNTARWRSLIDYLEKHIDLTVYAIDAPAHGGSAGTEFNSLFYAEFINVACENFKPDIVIGHSIGAGSIAYCMSEVKHHNIDKMIFMGSPDTFTEIATSYINIIGLNKYGQKALHKAIVKRFNLEPSDYSISKYVRRITTKGLVIHDKQDDISVIKNGETIAKNWDNARLMITDGYGHGLQHESIFKVVKEFIIA
jgi:pimeloyl-ACP methyl ester carboxylesterase